VEGMLESDGHGSPRPGEMASDRLVANTSPRTKTSKSGDLDTRGVELLGNFLTIERGTHRALGGNSAGTGGRGASARREDVELASRRGPRTSARSVPCDFESVVLPELAKGAVGMNISPSRTMSYATGRPKGRRWPG
jgi:hypothetical protein